MAWYRHRNMFNSGYDSWDYGFTDGPLTDDDIDEIISTQNYEYRDSDGYRRCEVERLNIADVPLEVFRRTMDEVDRIITRQTYLRQQMLKELLEHQLATFERESDGRASPKSNRKNGRSL